MSTESSRTSNSTQGFELVSPKNMECGGSIEVVELYGPDNGPDVPMKDRTSQTVGSQPSRVYFTITDEEALPLSDFPMPPRG